MVILEHRQVLKSNAYTTDPRDSPLPSGACNVQYGGCCNPFTGVDAALQKNARLFCRISSLADFQNLRKETLGRHQLPMFNLKSTPGLSDTQKTVSCLLPKMLAAELSTAFSLPILALHLFKEHAAASPSAAFLPRSDQSHVWSPKWGAAALADQDILGQFNCRPSQMENFEKPALVHSSHEHINVFIANVR